MRRTGRLRESFLDLTEGFLGGFSACPPEVLWTVFAIGFIFDLPPLEDFAGVFLAEGFALFSVVFSAVFVWPLACSRNHATVLFIMSGQTGS